MTENPFPEVYDITVENDAFGPDSDPALRHEVIDMLRTGWSPGRIARFVHQTLGITLAVSHVAELRKALPPVALLPPGKLAKRLDLVDLEIDTLGELARTIRVAEDRLDSALLVEEASGSPPTKKTSQLLEQYAKLLQQYAELKMKMGLIPEEPVKIDVTSKGEALAVPTLREIHDRVQRERSEADNGVPA